MSNFSFTSFLIQSSFSIPPPAPKLLPAPKLWQAGRRVGNFQSIFNFLIFKRRKKAAGKTPPLGVGRRSEPCYANGQFLFTALTPEEKGFG